MLCANSGVDRDTVTNARLKAAQIYHLANIARVLNRPDLENLYVKKGVEHTSYFQTYELEHVFARRSYNNLIYIEKDEERIDAIQKHYYDSLAKLNICEEIVDITRKLVRDFHETQSFGKTYKLEEFEEELQNIEYVEQIYSDITTQMYCLITRFTIFELTNTFIEPDDILSKIEKIFFHPDGIFDDRKRFVQNYYVKLCIRHNRIHTGLAILEERNMLQPSFNKNKSSYNHSTALYLLAFLYLRNGQGSEAFKVIQHHNKWSDKKSFSRNLNEIIEVLHAYVHFMAFYKEENLPPKHR